MILNAPGLRSTLSLDEATVQKLEEAIKSAPDEIFIPTTITPWNEDISFLAEGPVDKLAYFGPFTV